MQYLIVELVPLPGRQRAASGRLLSFLLVTAYGLDRPELYTAHLRSGQRGSASIRNAGRGGPSQTVRDGQSVYCEAFP